MAQEVSVKVTFDQFIYGDSWQTLRAKRARFSGRANFLCEASGGRGCFRVNVFSASNAPEHLHNKTMNRLSFGFNTIVALLYSLACKQ